MLQNGVCKFITAEWAIGVCSLLLEKLYHLVTSYASVQDQTAWYFIEVGNQWNVRNMLRADHEIYEYDIYVKELSEEIIAFETLYAVKYRETDECRFKHIG